MKRIAGSFTLLLAGLGGCVSFTAPPGQGEVKHTAAQVRPFVGQPASSGPLLPPATVPAATPPRADAGLAELDDVAGPSGRAAPRGR